MQNTASLFHFVVSTRFEARFAVGFSRRLACRIARLQWILAGVALAASAWTPSVTAQVVVKDLQPVSLQFTSAAQNGIRAHQAQVRARQAQVRQAKTQAALPRIANGLTMTGDQGSIPLRVRDAPPPLPGPKRVEPSTMGVINNFIRGDLYTDADTGTASGVSTTDFTVGSDYRVSRDLMFGLAAGRLNTGEANGSTMSAYLTLQPVDRIFLDMSLSYGMHQARSNEALRSGGFTGVAADGASRGFSVSLNHPRQVGEWFWSPYSRYDHIVTDVDTRAQSVSAPPTGHGLSAMSVGSTAATTWVTPFGAVRPMVMVELQKEVVSLAGNGTPSSQTQGIVGFGMTTKVSRDMSAFAESRYESNLAATLDRQMMLGVKFAF